MFHWALSKLYYFEMWEETEKARVLRLLSGRADLFIDGYLWLASNLIVC